MITCDPRHQNITPADTVIETPWLVVEILSNSTEATDRRQGDIGWQIITLSPGDPVELNSVEILTDFAAIYEESGLAF